jgi:hypothetical protein
MQFFLNSTGPFCTQVNPICLRAKDKKILENLGVLKVGVQGRLFQENSNDIQHFQGTIKMQTNFIHVCVLNYIFFS